MDFESNSFDRRVLVTLSLYAIIFFQAAMLLICSVSFSDKQTIYFAAVIIIQVLVLVSVFQFFRKPWKGTVLKIEVAEEVQKEKLFDEISSFHDIGDPENEGVDVGLANPQKVTEKEKRDALRKTYEDPFEEILKIM